MSAHFYDFKNYIPNNYKTNLMLPYPPNLRKPLTNKCNLKEKIETTKHQKQKKNQNANIHKKCSSITNEYNTQIKKKLNKNSTNRTNKHLRHL